MNRPGLLVSIKEIQRLHDMATRSLNAMLDAAIDNDIPLVTVKLCMDDYARDAERAALIAGVEALRASDFLNRNARVA
jgi:hypothetical protein